MKRYYLFIFASLFVFGCSSAQKKPDSVPTPSSKSSATEAPAQTPSMKPRQHKGASTLAASAECKLNADDRKLEIQDKGAGCELMYTKFGETKNVASSKGKAHCKVALAHIKQKLEASGFKCQ